MLPHTSQAQPSPSRAFSKVTIWMTRSGDVNTDWDVKSVSCKSPSFTDRINIEKEKNASRCLHPSIWEAIKPYIEEATHRTIAIDRLFAINLPGLMLRNINICATKTKSGLMSLMIIFKEAIGALSRLFAPGKAPSSFEDAQTAIATTILENVIIPTLNLCHTPLEALQKAPADALEKRLKTLCDAKQDLDFYATLLTRFLTQQEQVGTRREALDNVISNVYDLRQHREACG